MRKFFDQWYPAVRPVKTEVLYEDPFVVKFHEVYHPSEIDYLKRKASTAMGKYFGNFPIDDKNFQSRHWLWKLKREQTLIKGLNGIVGSPDKLGYGTHQTPSQQK